MLPKLMFLAWECLIHNIMNLLHSDLRLRLATLKMSSGEHEGGVIEVESEEDSAFVASLPLHTCLHSTFINSFDPMTHFLPDKPKDQAPNHSFLINESVRALPLLNGSLIQSFLEEVPQSRDVSLVVASEDSVHSQLACLLEPNHHDIRHFRVKLTLDHLPRIHVLII